MVRYLDVTSIFVTRRARGWYGPCFGDLEACRGIGPEEAIYSVTWEKVD